MHGKPRTLAGSKVFTNELVTNNPSHLPSPMEYFQFQSSVFLNFSSIMDRWVGKTAVVTGASAGIGAAIAVALANEGMNVVGLARRAERVQELSKQVKRKGSEGKIFAMKCDVSKVPEVISTFDAIKNQFGGVDVLVNNAAILKYGPTTDLGKDAASNEDIQSVIETNVVAPVICTREAIRSMVQRMVAGHVIHINSIAGHYVPNMQQSWLNVYPPTKFFITGLTEVIRQEISHNSSKIKVTSISPGYVRTEIFEASGAPKEVGEGLNAIEGLSSQDIADALLYVLGTPPHVNVSELTVRPVGEMY